MPVTEACRWTLGIGYAADYSAGRVMLCCCLTHVNIVPETTMVKHKRYYNFEI
jgi:hypothetical protein